MLQSSAVYVDHPRHRVDFELHTGASSICCHPMALWQWCLAGLGACCAI